MNRYEAHLLTLGCEGVDSLLSSLSDRTHGDDHALGVGGAVVVEQTVFAAGDGRNLVHVVLYNLRHIVVGSVAGLAVLEEDVAVLGHAARYGSLGRKSALTEACEGLAVEQTLDVLLLELLDLLDLMRGAEAVEEVDEGDRRFDGAQVSHTGEVHNLLYGAFAQHGEACLAHRHHILMVAEDAQGMRSEGTSRNVEHAGELLAGYLVHVGDHEEQTLRSCVGGGEGTGL